MPLRDNQGRFCGTLSRKEADGGWELSFFVLDEEKLLLRYFSLTNCQEEILDWDDFEGEIDIRFITKIEDKSITEGYIEIQTCNKKFCVRAVTQGGTEEWVRTLRKAVVNPPKRQEGPQEKSKSLPSENDRDNGGNSKLAHISYQTKIIGGVVVRTPVRKSSDSDRTSSLSGDSRVRTGCGGPTSTIKIIKEGYLVKKGAVVRNWKRRFFRLDILKLAYYEKKEDKDPLKVISTAAIQSVRESIGLDSYREHLFEVNTDSRTFLFQAESAEEMKLWINALVGVSGKRGRSASGPPAPTMDSVKPTYENYAETTNL